MAESSLLLFLLITFANAFSTKNGTSKTQNYSNTTEPPLQSNYTAPPLGIDLYGVSGDCCDPGCFVNCSYSDPEDAEGGETCYENSPPSLFDEYWCENLAGDNDYIMKGLHGPLFSGFEPSIRSHCYSLEAADFSSWYAKGDTLGGWGPTYTSPCCDLFSCDLTVATANLIYWPTPAPVPNVTSIISNGFTFISPSAYVNFRDVAATNNCGLIGSSITSTILAFAPWDLSFGDFPYEATSINYAQIPTNCPISSAANYSAASYSYCFQTLIMPPQIWAFNPAWANCDGSPAEGQVLQCIMDPPRALMPTAALAPSPTNIPDPSVSAAPASAPLQPLAPITELLLNSSPLPVSNTKFVPVNARPTASHGLGDPVETNRASYVDPPPSPTVDGIDRPVRLPPLNNNDWESDESWNPATVSQPQQTPVLTFAGSIYTADTATHFVIAGETLAPGSSINPFGTPIYLASDGVVAAIGSGLAKQTLTTPTSVQLTAQLMVAGATYTADSASRFIIASQTLSQGGAITVSSTPISWAIGGATAIVGMNSQALFPTPQPLILTFGGSHYTADISSAFSIGRQILTPGGAITISNTPISLVPGGTIAVEGTHRQLLASNQNPTQAPVLTLNGITYTADKSSEFTIEGQTLIPGNSIIVSGTQISLAVGGTLAVVGTSIQLLNPAEPTAKVPLLTFEGTTYTADASSAFIINGQALTAGGAVRVDGTPLSLDIEGTAAIIGSSTQMLGTATITGSHAATIHLGAQAYTEESAGEFDIGGQTLMQCGEITVGGTPVSFQAGGTGVVIDSSTEAVGVGGWIMSGLGPGAAPTGVVPFEGKGLIRRMKLGRVLVVIAIVEYFISMH